MCTCHLLIAYRYLKEYHLPLIFLIKILNSCTDSLTNNALPKLLGFKSSVVLNMFCAKVLEREKEIIMKGGYIPKGLTRHGKKL